MASRSKVEQPRLPFIKGSPGTSPVHKVNSLTGTSTKDHTKSSEEPVLYSPSRTAVEIDRTLPEEICYVYACNPSSAEAQEARREYLRGKIILFVCCGNDLSKRAVYERIKVKLGVEAILIEAPENPLATLLLEEGIISEYVQLDMAPRGTLLPECLEAVKSHLEKSSGLLSGVCTFWDDAVGLSARLAEALNLPGNPVHSVDIAHEKAAARKFCQLHQLPTPLWATLTCPEDIKHAAEKVTFPAIIKPAFGAASLGVMKVRNADDLPAKYNEAMAMLEELYREGELMGLVFQDAEDVANKIEDRMTLCLEEMLEGPEVNLDVVMSQGDVVFCCLSDDWPCREPWYCELGLSTPSQLPSGDATALKAAAAEILRAMGFVSGVFHVEMILDYRYGPTLVEVNPRMGGGPVFNSVLHVCGVDLVEEQLFCSIGLPCNPPQLNGKPGAHLKNFVSLIVFSPMSGVLLEDSDRALDFLKDYPEVVFRCTAMKKGSRIVSWLDGFPSHVGRVDITALRPLEELLALKETIYVRIEENLRSIIDVDVAVKNGDTASS